MIRIDTSGWITVADGSLRAARMTNYKDGGYSFNRVYYTRKGLCGCGCGMNRPATKKQVGTFKADPYWVDKIHEEALAFL